MASSLPCLAHRHPRVGARLRRCRYSSAPRPAPRWRPSCMPTGYQRVWRHSHARAAAQAAAPPWRRHRRPQGPGDHPAAARDLPPALPRALYGPGLPAGGCDAGPARAHRGTRTSRAARRRASTGPGYADPAYVSAITSLTPTSHAELDRDSGVQGEVDNVARALACAVRQLRADELRKPDRGLVPPR
ncbi:hypothetical protein N234_29575 [Ralstonia pickettii DTP0602]|nr:hypothetical protein N234_29575 [Ralstonia pickettii DTP0602]